MSLLGLGFMFNDDLSGIIFATKLKIEKIEDSMNLGAVYVAATSPDMKYIAVRPGMRKEEVAELCQKRLGWTDEEKADFAEFNTCTNEPIEGYLFPDEYIVPKNSKPEDLKKEMQARFHKVFDGSQLQTAKINPFDTDTVITVASLIQREAAGKVDMNLISGIIWNRVFKDMALDIDATLQYVKGDEKNWWPQVKSEDKFIDSAYNTYKNKGLPPGAISNPSLAAISAALNPQKTSCMFYLHDKYGRIHCSKTYAEHKQNIRWYLK